MVLVIEAHSASDSGWRVAEQRECERVAEYHDPRAVRSAIFEGERAPDFRLDAERREQLDFHERALESDRRLITR